MSGKKNDGFEDWEADFFSQGEAGELSWEEEAKQAEEAAAKAAAEKAAAEAAAKEAEEKAAAEAAAKEAEEKAAAEAAEAAAKEAEEKAAAEAAAKEAEEKAAAEAAEAERVAAEEKAAAEAAEAERVAAEEKAAAEAAEAAEAERLAAEAAEAARLAAEREAAELEAAEAEERRLVQERAAAEAARAEHERLEEETRLAAEAARQEAAAAQAAADAQAPRISMPIAAQVEETGEATMEALPEDAIASEPEDEDQPTEAVPLGQKLDTMDGPPLEESSVDQHMPATPHVSYEPSADDGERWRAMVRTLEAEAAASEGADAAGLYAEAARIARTRIADLAEAERLAQAGVALDGQDLRALRELERALNRNQRFEALREAMEALANAEQDDAAAAEILQDAALLARRRLGQDDQAARLLVASVARNPSDFFSLQLLRDVQLVGGDWEGIVDTLAQMAGLSSGVLAARLQYERGRVFAEQLGQSDKALDAFRASHEADPAHGPSFVALERGLEQSQSWAELAELYLGEAERVGGADGAFFATRAGRILRGRLFEGDKAEEAYKLALSLGGGAQVRHEYEALLVEQGRFEDLAASLRQASTSEDGAATGARFRLAGILEKHLEDSGAALEIYMELAKDPSAVPAAEGVARILRKQERFAELRDFWGQRSDLLDDPNLKVTLAYRRGEIAEGPLADQEAARKDFEAVLDIAPAYLPALEGLERVYTRLQEWEKLAAVYEQRAILNEDPAAIALQLHRAGATCELRMGDLERAKGFFHRALEHKPDFSPSLDAIVRLLELDGDWRGLASVLMAAGEASQEGSQQVSFFYRAGRILADKVLDDGAAIAAVERCLELSPGFLGAHYFLKELKGKVEDLAGLYQLQVSEAQSESDLDRKAWQYLSASALAHDLPEADPTWAARQILEAEPSHPAALAVLEEAYLRQGDSRALVGLYRNAVASADDPQELTRLMVALADQLRESGDTMGTIQTVGELVHAEGEGRPLLALSRLCEGLNYWEEAHRAADAAQDTYESARLQEDYLEAPAEALAGYRKVLEEDPENLGAIFGCARLERKAGNREGLAQAHWQVATSAADAPVKVVHSVLAGHLFEGLGQREEALEAYRLAFATRPSAGKAFEGVRRLLLQEKDLDALVAHYEGLSPADTLGLAASLEEAGDSQRSAEVLEEAQDIAGLLRREAAQEAAQDWQGTFETLSARAALLQDPEQQQAALAKQRWILAEKLAETDAAWDFYRQLHEEHPEDTEVLEALARIAGARGEVDLSLQYLEQLSQNLSSAEDAGRVQRRIAEVQSQNGNLEEARAAYMAALDHNPQDTEALSGLRAVAEANEDWQAMVGVLARESALQTGAEQVTTTADIARLWQDKLGDDAVAGDAWRKVLELDPEHQEALERLLALSESAGAWSEYVMHAEQLAAQREGAESKVLLGKAGKVWLQQLRNEDRALTLLDTASAGDSPDLDAARMLEQLRSARGEWDGVVEALKRQAAASSNEQDAVKALVRAARVQRDTLQNRDGAAQTFAAVLEQEPAHDEALRYLADHAYRKQELPQAVEYFAELEKKSESWDLDDFDEKVEIAQFYFQYATSLISLDRADEGREKLERALELNPSHLPSLRAVGPLWMEAKEWDKAEGVYRQVLQLIGGSADKAELAEAYTCLGEVELALGKTEKAKKRFNKALELRDNDVRALRGAAQVLFEREEWSTLLNHYNNIIYHAKKPSYVIEAYLTKGFVLDTHMGLSDKAAQHYEKSLTFDPGQVQALTRLAELSLRRQDWGEASALADRGLGVEDKDGRMESLLHLAKAAASYGAGDPSTGEDNLAQAKADESVGAALADVAANAQALSEALKSQLTTL